MKTTPKEAEAPKVVTWQKGRKSITRVIIGPDGKRQTIKRARTTTHDVDGIRIRELPKPSGEGVYFRVETPASLGNKRQFPTLPEAQGYAAKLVVMRERSGLEAFGLNDQQRAEAVKCFKLLAPSNSTLTQAVEFYLQHAMPAGGERSVDQAVDEFMKAKRNPRLNLRQRTLDDLEDRLNRFSLTHGTKPVKTLFPPDIESHLANADWSNQTALNEWRVLHGFFQWCLEKKYVASNAVAAVAKPNVDTRQPGIFTVDQTRALLLAALQKPELELGAYVALGFFAGVRREELVRLEWRDLDTSRGLLTISERISKKRGVRNIELSETALAWLKAFGTKTEGKIAPTNLQRRLAKLRIEAGFTVVDPETKKATVKVEWPDNALRHSFGSFHYALHQDAEKTRAILGQATQQVLFDHYRRLAPKSEAEKFFGIVPPVDTAAEKVIPFPTKAA